MTTDINKMIELAGQGLSDNELRALAETVERRAKAYTEVSDDHPDSEMFAEDYRVAMQKLGCHQFSIRRLLDALEAANKRITELETVNRKMKDDVRRGRRIIADLEDDHS